jgi:hypothetical protein
VFLLAAELRLRTLTARQTALPLAAERRLEPSQPLAVEKLPRRMVPDWENGLIAAD